MNTRALATTFFLSRPAAVKPRWFVNTPHSRSNSRSQRTHLSVDAMIGLPTWRQCVHFVCTCSRINACSRNREHSHPMNTKILSGPALEKALAAKLEELLRGVDWLRGWQVEHVGGVSDAGFDLLATVPLSGGGKAALCV